MRRREERRKEGGKEDRKEGRKEGRKERRKEGSKDGRKEGRTVGSKPLQDCILLKGHDTIRCAEHRGSRIDHLARDECPRPYVRSILI